MQTPDPVTPPILDANYLPPPPPLPIPQQIDISESLNALGEPTLASLGLCNWTPPGLVQKVLETLHVTLDIPWWSSIVVGVVCLRILIFPVIIYSQRNTKNLANHMPHLVVLQQKLTTAQRNNNLMEVARFAKEIQDYNAKHDLNILKNFTMPLVQAPIFVSVFFGLRKMAELPVESMKDGGMFWFSDLTIADPYYLLPIMSMLTMSAIIEVGADGMKSDAMAPLMKWVLRGLPLIILPFVSHFPAAMLCYWCTSNLISLVQAAFLRIPAVRVYFRIPETIVHDKSAAPPSKGFVQGFKDSIQNSRVIVELQNRERADAIRFKEAGTGPLKKTYKYDPTRVQRTTPQKHTTRD